ncbi:MAG TPA: tetratricopeptide repeat protein [Chloroflexia bacterium]|nr:tetratricopeptide repeat protein [Chloroflexia bacterium]
MLRLKSQPWSGGLLTLVVVAGLLAACGDPPATPTRVPAPPATATAAAPPTAVPPTDTTLPPTVAATLTAAPTETAVSVAATDTVPAADTPPATPPAAGDAAGAFAAGLAAAKNADYAGAVAAFSQAIAAQPNDEPAYVNRAAAYFHQGEVDKALTDLDKALAIQPNDANAALLAGVVFQKKGDAEKALQAFSYVIQLQPSDPGAYFARADVYLGQQDTEHALVDLQQVVALSPDSDLGKRAAAAIAQIQGGQAADVTPAPAADAAAEGDAAPTPLPPTPSPVAGQLIADLGFRPAVDGFQFENYGFTPGRVNLTPADVQRMFGDQVCGSQAGGCILTPPAQQWMDAVNKDMDGGHCEGFAALSLAFFSHQEAPTKFGAPRTFDLNIEGNAALQREIAYFFATQATEPTLDKVITKTPAEILDLLIASFKQNAGPADRYTLGIYQPGFKGGHAITPYAVEDRGNGQFAVRVYDNNFPGDERFLLIDRPANTWSYLASTNPNEPESEYRGDATTGTLDITPTTPRLQPQVCPFCGPAAAARAGGHKQAAPEQQYNQLWLEGDGHLLLADKDGHQTGFQGDTFVNTIPGVQIEAPRSSDLWKNSAEPVYFVPLGLALTVTVDGGTLKTETHSNITLIGPGYDLGIDDIVLHPGQKDTITFAGDGRTIAYKTDYTESPDIVLGTDTTAADYSFLVKGVDIESGGTMTLHLDPDKATLSLSTKGNKETGTYGLVLDRIDAKGEQTFDHDGITLQAQDTAYIDYGKWTGTEPTLPVQIDHGSDGTIDETIQLTDSH